MTPEPKPIQTNERTKQNKSSDIMNYYKVWNETKHTGREKGTSILLVIFTCMREKCMKQPARKHRRFTFLITLSGMSLY